MSNITTWCHPWPAYITNALVSETNPGGTHDNSNLDISSLVLHKAIFLSDTLKAVMAALFYGLDNTPTFSWIMWELSTINPVILDLLQIHTLH